MLVLVDTNVLLRIAKPDDPHHQLALDSLQQLRVARHKIVIVPQVCYEYYVVATRPVEDNGLGMQPKEAIRDIEDHISLFHFLRDERSIFDAWKGLLESYRITGKRAHDARLVAAMQRHGIANLLTFNQADFQRFAAITVLDPATV